MKKIIGLALALIFTPLFGSAENGIKILPDNAGMELHIDGYYGSKVFDFNGVDALKTKSRDSQSSTELYPTGPWLPEEPSGYGGVMGNWDTSTTTIRFADGSEQNAYSPILYEITMDGKFWATPSGGTRKEMAIQSGGGMMPNFYYFNGWGTGLYFSAWAGGMSDIAITLDYRLFPALTLGDQSGFIKGVFKNGKLGIGTENPAVALDVYGDIRSTGVIYGDASGLTNIPSSGGGLTSTQTWSGLNNWVAPMTLGTAPDSVKAGLQLVGSEWEPGVRWYQSNTVQFKAGIPWGESTFRLGSTPALASGQFTANGINLTSYPYNHIGLGFNPKNDTTVHVYGLGPGAGNYQNEKFLMAVGRFEAGSNPGYLVVITTAGRVGVGLGDGETPVEPEEAYKLQVGGNISATAYYGDGSNLTGVANLASTQTWTGENSFSGAVTISSTAYVGFANVTNTCNGATTCTATCTGSAVAMGGSCSTGLSATPMDSALNSGDYTCTTGVSANITAKVACARFGN